MMRRHGFVRYHGHEIARERLQIRAGVGHGIRADMDVVASISEADFDLRAHACSNSPRSPSAAMMRSTTVGMRAFLAVELDVGLGIDRFARGQEPRQDFFRVALAQERARLPPLHAVGEKLDGGAQPDRYGLAP